MLLASLFWSGCSAPASRRQDSGLDVDAVIKSGNAWYLFRFGSKRYLRIPAAGADFPAVGAFADPWLEIASPSGVFRPVGAVAGWPASSGHFYLVDAGGNRLCLYDGEARLLSTFPLPSESPHPIPGKAEIFRGQGGGFTLVDYLEGEARQYADRQSGEGVADWVLRSRVKLPLGLRDCVQEPADVSLACRLRGEPLRLDGSMNRMRATAEEADAGRKAMVWDADAGEWALEADSAASPFRYWPARRKLIPSAHRPP